MLLLKCKGVYRRLGMLVQLPGECFFWSKSPTEICPRDFSVAVLPLARNGRLLADVILRHKVPKNLVPSNKNPFVRRTRCFTSFSMTSRGGLPCTGMVSIQSRIAYEFHHRDFSIAVSRLTRNDNRWRRAIPKHVISNPCKG